MAPRYASHALRLLLGVAIFESLWLAYPHHTRPLVHHMHISLLHADLKRIVCHGRTNAGSCSLKCRD